uniref:Chloroplast zeaxanthin epoxidase 2 n=1 Tax=Lobosphaera incisa TaxID=312850 RepID=A0A1Y0AWT2_9CHLO|nr:chloroplast zeaxanthin epoxidase 2 [Lobosphaera incisa]
MAVGLAVQTSGSHPQTSQQDTVFSTQLPRAVPANCPALGFRRLNRRQQPHQATRVCRAAAATKDATAVATPAGSSATGSDDLINHTEDSVLVAGAGIGGLAVAAALHKVGIPVIVLERSEKLREEGGAIALWTNAFRALDALGVAHTLRDEHPLLERVELATKDGRVLRSFGLDECEGAPHEFRGMRRSDLLKALASNLPLARLHYGCAIARVSSDLNGAVVVLEDGRRFRGRAVVGADGVRSCVAATLNMPEPSYAGYAAHRGIASFPEGLPLPLNTVRQVWGTGVRAGMYPVSANEVYWFTVFNEAQSPIDQTPGQRKAEALATVRGWRLGVEEAVEATPARDITRNRITDRWGTPGLPFGDGAITLVGDAAHPMTPNLGQGGCAALEDAVVLARCLRDTAPSPGAHAPDWFRAVSTASVAEALRKYERERTERCVPLTIRSHMMGRLLQLPFLPVSLVRNAFVAKFFSPAHFLDHAKYDCGSL